jgi:hypothetical protein
MRKYDLQIYLHGPDSSDAGPESNGSVGRFLCLMNGSYFLRSSFLLDGEDVSKTQYSEVIAESSSGPRLHLSCMSWFNGTVDEIGTP